MRIETEEGKVFWIDIRKLPDMEQAEGFKERLPMFLDSRLTEGFGTWNRNGTGKMHYL
jgi:8-oxo-dGTP diphosphatase